MRSKQWEQKQRHDASSRVRSFSIEEMVYVKIFGPGSTWLSVITVDPLYFMVEVNNIRDTKTIGIQVMWFLRTLENH